MSSPDQPKPVRKAVFPVAGLGTRFLPATKAIPKEMMPLVDRPIIQYAVEEAVASGIECTARAVPMSGRGDRLALRTEQRNPMRVGISLTSAYTISDPREGARWMIERAAAEIGRAHV